jgi:signal peptidase I
MSRRRRLLRVGVLLTLAAVLLSVRLLVAAPVRVAGDSMAPTLLGGEVVLIDKLGRDDVARGDLVVFRDADGSRSVKRVVGVAGDRVVIRDAVLSVNDEPVVEPYVDPETIDGLYTPTTTVPVGSVFVLGDNRARSIDSRDLGPVPLAEVDGLVVARLWPLGCLDPVRPCR